jgi:pentatricopeptide repeat domain-containing protein 1
MNAEILGAMLRQACCHFNFEYVLAIMETTLQEEVRPNEKFMEHLENFHEECQKKIRNKVYHINVNKL